MERGQRPPGATFGAPFGLPSLRFALAVGLLGSALACSPTAPPEASCQERSPLTHASTEEVFLGLSAQERRAIVELVDGSSWTPDASLASVSLCSGTFVGNDWVLTATHCLAIPNLTVIVTSDGATPAAFRAVTDVQPSPGLDVALLKVAPQPVDAGSTDLVPIRPAAAADVQGGVGTRAELAGYGLTEGSTWGQLRFLVEPIVTVGSTIWEVDGFGRSGACEGDSGGPLLLRGANGRPVLAGILAGGATSCADGDSYTRVDVLESWIDSIVGELPPGDDDCGEISAEGRCFGAEAVFCQSGRIDAATCQAGLQCGWSDAAGGFRCVPPSDDACAGAGSFGVCRGGDAITCAAGNVTITKCLACGACAVDGVTGAARCWP